MILRSWQQKIIDDFPSIIKQNKRFILKAPTGAGKTILASEIVERFYKDKKILVVADYEKEILIKMIKKKSHPTPELVKHTISSGCGGMLGLAVAGEHQFISFSEKVEFIKIVIASILMGFIFQFLLNFFQNELVFEQKAKSFYLLLSALLGLAFYLLICYFIKAFKISDIKLKY